MLRTEMRNPRTTHIDQMDTMDILRCMQAENLAAVQAERKEVSIWRRPQLFPMAAWSRPGKLAANS